MVGHSWIIKVFYLIVLFVNDDADGKTAIARSADLFRLSGKIFHCSFCFRSKEEWSLCVFCCTVADLKEASMVRGI